MIDKWMISLFYAQQRLSNLIEEKDFSFIVLSAVVVVVVVVVVVSIVSMSDEINILIDSNQNLFDLFFFISLPRSI